MKVSKPGADVCEDSGSDPGTEVGEAWTLFLRSPVPLLSLAWAPSSRAPTMAFPSRVHHPSVIPKREEIPQSVLSSVRQANGNEDERAVSKVQRRQSDVKVYKEFCDFYAKL